MTWASLFGASDDSSEYKYGHEDELSVKTNCLRCASVKTHFLYLSYSSRIYTGWRRRMDHL